LEDLIRDIKPQISPMEDLKLKRQREEKEKQMQMALELDELEDVLGVDKSKPLQPVPRPSGPGAGALPNPRMQSNFIAPQMKFYHTNVAEGITSYVIGVEGSDNQLADKVALYKLKENEKAKEKAEEAKERERRETATAGQKKAVDLDALLVGVDPEIEKKKKEREDMERKMKEDFYSMLVLQILNKIGFT